MYEYVINMLKFRDFAELITMILNLELKRFSTNNAGGEWDRVIICYSSLERVCMYVFYIRLLQDLKIQSIGQDDRSKEIILILIHPWFFQTLWK